MTSVPEAIATGLDKEPRAAARDAFTQVESIQSLPRTTPMISNREYELLSASRPATLPIIPFLLLFICCGPVFGGNERLTVIDEDNHSHRQQPAYLGRR
jgi:hypothetical protein